MTARRRVAPDLWTAVALCAGAGAGAATGVVLAGGSGIALGTAMGAGLGVVVGAVAQALGSNRSGPGGARRG